MQMWSARSDEDITRTIEQHSDMLFRICLIRLGNQHDAYDAVQDTFIRYMTKAPVFVEEGHEKAWLIRVASNICKDMQRFSLRHRWIDISEIADVLSGEENRELCNEDDIEILSRILKLPDKYKSVIQLHYVEGYKIKEISDILSISVPAVKKRMQRGRAMLKISEAEDREVTRNG